VNECCLKPSKELLSLKSIPSDVEIVAPNIRDVFAPATCRVDGEVAGPIVSFLTQSSPLPLSPCAHLLVLANQIGCLLVDIDRIALQRMKTNLKFLIFNSSRKPYAFVF